MRTIVTAAALLVAAFSEAHGAESARHLTLLHVSDLHAQLESHPEHLSGEPGLPMMGGFARLRTALQRERAAAKGASFAIDGGDTFQGSGPADWSRGEVVVAPLGALGLDLGVPGNWEVAYGAERFRELMRAVPFPEIAYHPRGRRHADRPRQRLPLRYPDPDGADHGGSAVEPAADGRPPQDGLDHWARAAGLHGA
jgi:2',3'-cyclic-nucleotide 2'-phosphodiesterase (5'-nucleotidase family)